MQNKVLKLDLGKRSYDIHIGGALLAKTGELLRGILPSNKVIIISDENVAPLYMDGLRSSLENSNIQSETIILPAGEKTKSFSQFESLLEDILSLSPDRKTTLIALGGGVIGDITGFAASVILRGIPFVQIPTTLLAQIDSSVGGKTAINSNHGKNLIGSFYQPLVVIADINVLETLPDRELKSGYGEMVKYGLIDMPSFFDWLENNGSIIIDSNHAECRDKRLEAVMKCCESKARIVEDDERESGKRALLNLGHTFAHALEKETGYSDILLHGEAVAIGIIMAFELSKNMGFCSSEDVGRVKNHMQSMGLSAYLTDVSDAIDWNSARLTNHCKQDKKASNGKMTFILAKGIGESFICNDIPEDKVLAVFEGFL